MNVWDGFAFALGRAIAGLVEMAGIVLLACAVVAWSTRNDKSRG